MPKSPPTGRLGSFQEKERKQQRRALYCSRELFFATREWRPPGTFQERNLTASRRVAYGIFPAPRVQQMSMENFLVSF
jgi:hypothetical protein